MNITRKSMAEGSLLGYLNNMKILAGFLILSLVSISQAAPRFLVFSEGAQFDTELKFLQSQGARIEKRIPSRVAIVNIPSTFDLSTVSSIQNSYGNEIPLASISSLGPLVIAAAQQWNRNVLSDAKGMGASSFAALSTRVGSLSLPSPTNVSGNRINNRLQLSWSSSLGTALFHVQFSDDPFFNRNLIETQTNENTVSVPYLSDFSGDKVYVRVRSFERSSNDSDLTFLYGSWSATQQLPIQTITQVEDLSAPSLTSPLNSHESEGFTLIMEWSTHSGDRSRVQISRDQSFSDIFIDSVVDSREFVVPSGALEVGRTYYWRAQAWGPRRSPWSSVRNFRIGEPRTIGTDMFVNPERPQ